MAMKDGDNEQDPKKDTSGTENEDVHVETVESEADGEEEEEFTRQEEEEFKPEAEDSDSDDGSSYSGSSLCSDDTLYRLEKQRQKKKFDDAVLKQKETEECWSSMQPKQKHDQKLPTQNANSVVKQEPAKKKHAEGKGKRKKPEGDDEEGRKRKPQVKRAPGC